MQCATQNGVQSCADSTYTFADNIFRGYDNPGTYSEGGQAGGPGMYCGAGCNSSTALIGKIIQQNNLTPAFAAVVSRTSIHTISLSATQPETSSATEGAQRASSA